MVGIVAPMLARTGLGAIVAASLAACRSAEAPIASHDVVGQYRGTLDGRRVHLDVNADGTFEVFVGERSSDLGVFLRGRWERGEQQAASSAIRLMFDDPRGKPELGVPVGRVLVTQAAAVLESWVGSPVLERVR